MTDTQRCNVCDEGLHAQILRGQGGEIAIEEKTDNCPTCRARPRIKTFRIAYDQRVKSVIMGRKEERESLVVAGVTFTRSYIGKDFGRVISTALYGQYGKDTVRSDIRLLTEFADSQFHYVHATLVLDYIVEHKKVFHAVRRVLKPGGIFLFHIAESRLLPDATPTYVKNYKKEIIYKEQYPEDHQMPSIRVGRQYLISEMKSEGFEVDELEIEDIFSGVICTWFLGRRL